MLVLVLVSAVAVVREEADLGIRSHILTLTERVIFLAVHRPHANRPAQHLHTQTTGDIWEH